MELDCGIPYQRIASWLSDELALARSGEGWVFDSDGETCFVFAQKLESRPLGMVHLERTAVRFDGSQQAEDAFMHLFTLRFMSAGG